LAVQLQFKIGIDVTTALGTADDVMGFGAYRCSRADLTVGGLLVCLAYVASQSTPNAESRYLASSSVDCGSSPSRRVFEVLDLDERIRDTGAPP
jgi:hypothetical protein